jgi:hypothetical protein
MYYKRYVFFMAWTNAMSLFHYGYTVIYLTQIPTETIKEIYNINLENAATEGLLNGFAPIGGLFGAIASSFLIPRFSRRYLHIYVEIIC